MSLVDEFLSKERELFNDPLLASLTTGSGPDIPLAATPSHQLPLDSTQGESDESVIDSSTSSLDSLPPPPPAVGKRSTESKKIDEWKLERAGALKKKDEEENKKMADLRDLAAQQLRTWYSSHGQIVEGNKVLNRANDLKNLKAAKKATTAPDWNAIATVWDTPSGHQLGVDTTRMKTAILKMVSAESGAQMSPIPRKMGLIVAMDLDGGIAKAGKIPWNLRKDMAFFKQITSTTTDKTKKNAVIMGRKCWESIPAKFRPLKDRLNVVVSRTLPEQKSADLIISNNFDEIFDELSSNQEIESIWNIGGTEIYRLAMEKDLIDRLIVTKIDKRYDTDLFLKMNWDNFTENPETTVDVEEDGTKFSIHFYSPR